MLPFKTINFNTELLFIHSFIHFLQLILNIYWVLDTVFNIGNSEIEDLVSDIEVLTIYQTWVIEKPGEQSREAYREHLKFQDKISEFCSRVQNSYMGIAKCHIFY